MITAYRVHVVTLGRKVLRIRNHRGERPGWALDIWWTWWPPRPRWTARTMPGSRHLTIRPKP